MKISVVGWYGKNNIGDEAFKEVFQRQLWGNDITFSQIPDFNSDVVVLGGGGVVTERYIQDIPKDFDKPLYAMGVDIAVNGKDWDEIRSLPFRRLYVRSKEYKDIAISNGGFNISYCPDIVFSLYEQRPIVSGKKCGVILSYDLKGGIDHLGKTLQRIKSKYDREIEFIVFYTGNNRDIEITQRVKDECGEDFPIIIPKTPIETLQLMSSFDLIISMRFHGSIFAATLGIPFLSLSNKGKCSLFCEQERLFGNHIELTEMNDIKILDRIDWIMENHKAMQKYLIDVASYNKLLVDNAFYEVKKELDLVR